MSSMKKSYSRYGATCILHSCVTKSLVDNRAFVSILTEAQKGKISDFGHMSTFFLEIILTNAVHL